MKITRRKLAAAALGSAAVGLRVRLTPAQTPVEENLNALAKAQVRSNAEALTKFQVPMATEPAFVFKA